ncbi:MAG: aconitate hydratase, partial [Actinophytocola sp.]|nr:aconitate hydratase [Actinophytocola sp.]
VGHNSLRTFPRNFPGRSGTREDSVWLCSPETAAAAALTGEIIDPGDLADKLGMAYPSLALPERASVDTEMMEAPLPPDEARREELVKGPNITALPDFPPLPDRIEAPVLLAVGDDVSTDEISPAGAKALPYRSNVDKLADFTFTVIDADYPARARSASEGHIVVGGKNYGQGSSREHAAITPRHLGLRAVLATSFARIHWQNLVNFGILPLEFARPDDRERIDVGDVLALDDLRATLPSGSEITVRNTTKDETYAVQHQLSPRQVDDVLAGGVIPRLARGG